MAQWFRVVNTTACQGCGDFLHEGDDAFIFDKEILCEGCHEDAQDCARDDDYDYRHDDYDIDFADPMGRSALRAASESNPRNQSCPTCHTPNVLTPADVALSYQCDWCADQDEGAY